MLLLFALRPNRIRWYAVCIERAIAYLRVSTQRQQRSGLGIEAQRALVQQFASTESLVIAAEFVEYESGKGAGPTPMDLPGKLALPWSDRGDFPSWRISDLPGLADDVRY